MKNEHMEEGGYLREGRLVEEVGEPWMRREGERTLAWGGRVAQGAVRFVFDIDAGLMLEFELEIGFARAAHSLKWRRKQVVTNPKRLGGVNGQNIRVKLLQNEGIQVYKLRHSVGIHQHKEESPRLKVIPQVFKKREH